MAGRNKSDWSMFSGWFTGEPGNQRSTLTNKQNGRQKFLRKFWSLNESFTSNETEDLEKISLPTVNSKKTQICSVLSLQKALIFGL